MTVPQYLPKQPQPSGEMVQLQIHTVGNGHSAVPRFCSHRMGTARWPFPTNTKTARFPGRQKEKLLLSQEPYVGITYFHGPSPGNYRRRK